MKFLWLTLVSFFPVLVQGNVSFQSNVIIDKNSLIKLSRNDKVKAFLDLLAHGEGTSYHPDVKILTDQYRLSFCNDGKISSFKDHPRKRCCSPVGKRIICATAAGRYMFLQKTWDWVTQEIDLHDFSPLNQDLAAIYLLVISGAMQDILQDNIVGAISKASRFWAPLPGNDYKQPQTRIKELLQVYSKRLNFHRRSVGELFKGKRGGPWTKK